MKKLFNNKGFSLLEVMVTMGIVGTLGVIAVPAYNQYRNNANDAVIKADVSSGHRAYLAHDAVNNTFCATLAGVGLTGIGSSDVYKGDSHAGFKSDTCTVSLTASDLENHVGSALSGASCVLDESSFVFGAAFKSGDTSSGYYMENDDTGPQTTTQGSCTGYSGCTSKANCEAAAHTCHAQATGQTWVASAITDVCN